MIQILAVTGAVSWVMLWGHILFVTSVNHVLEKRREDDYHRKQNGL